MKYLIFILGMVLSFGAKASNEQKVVLRANNTVVMRGEINTTMITQAQLDLVKLVKKRGYHDYPIYIVLDSPGGSIDAGNTFIEFAKTIPNLSTVTIFSASMAAAIVESIPGPRYILKDGVMMFHRAQARLEGYVETGEVESMLKLIQSLVLDMEKTNASRLGISLELYKSKVITEWWERGADAVAAGMNDAVVTATCTPQLIDIRKVVQTRMMFFSAKSLYSGCPLIRGPVQSQVNENDDN